MGQSLPKFTTFLKDIRGSVLGFDALVLRQQRLASEIAVRIGLRDAHDLRLVTQVKRLTSRVPLSMGEKEGLERELRAATKLKGYVLKYPNDKDPVLVYKQLYVRIDVIGEDFIALVGGEAKIADLDKFRTSLSNMKTIADAKGLRAIYVFAKNTPKQVLEYAKRCNVELVPLD